ncbi:MAG: cytochrome d ubiquinol oxidase subunit II [Propionibacteriaceae bacterium]|jgi:cytochrome d ubiquinol oxidase subunit II|nr:cytochrome d ubiquinol oxidase subunit II [Propionibacteriaceae bacterium]
MFVNFDVPTPTLTGVVWFLLIAVLWIGFFFLEGFDFGVSMLYQLLSRKQPEERRVMVNAIGPTWDSNEVWLLTAGGAMFAAFPGWYATLFSGLYLPLFLVLLGLIIRGISFEYRALHPSTRWKNTFDWLASIGSFVVALVLGVGFANFVIGLPSVAGPHGEPLLPTAFAPDWFFPQLFIRDGSPYPLLGGVMLVVLCISHGAQFLNLKTSGTVLNKVQRFAPAAAALAAVLVAGYLVWGNLAYPSGGNPYLVGVTLAGIARWVSAALAIGAVLLAAVLVKRKPGVAFTCSGLGVALLFSNTFITIFGTLGFVQPETGPALNIVTASASALTLQLMTIFAVILVPIVLGYVIWSYRVFRQRLSVENLPPAEHVDASASDTQPEPEAEEALNTAKPVVVA